MKDVVFGICAARSAGVISCRKISAAFILVLSLTGVGCSNDKPATTATDTSAPQSASQPAANSPAKPVEPVGPALHIDAARAMQYTKEIVAFGPRWDSSKPIDQVRAYIKDKLKGAQVEEDSFIAETSAGKMPMTHIIAKIPGSEDGIIVLG